MTLLKSTLLIVCVLSSSLVTSIPIDNHSNDHDHHKSLKVTEYPLPISQPTASSQEPSVPESPVINQESSIVQESSSSSSVSAQPNPASAIDSTSRAPNPSQKSTRAPNNTDSSNGLSVQQGSSIEQNVGSQESKVISIDISENVLQRVKRQGGGAQGISTRFCNQFGCNNRPARPNRNSGCPRGTRYDRRYNRCRRTGR